MNRRSRVNWSTFGGSSLPERDPGEENTALAGNNCAPFHQSIGKATMNTESATCPNCGKPVSPHALMALCPDCLLKAGLGAGSGATNGDVAAAFATPSPDALAPHFTQLE